MASGDVDKAITSLLDEVQQQEEFERQLAVKAAKVAQEAQEAQAAQVAKVKAAQAAQAVQPVKAKQKAATQKTTAAALLREAERAQLSMQVAAKLAAEKMAAEKKARSVAANAENREKQLAANAVGVAAKAKAKEAEKKVPTATAMVEAEVTTAMPVPKHATRSSDTPVMQTAQHLEQLNQGRAQRAAPSSRKTISGPNSPKPPPFRTPRRTQHLRQRRSN
mmetsp:Transcript_10182/g.23638  ORF Transcript_10182/g.23638 Transcript_10182/m.23638 type:complete len:221 (-) Transcript_10182:23-685(-)